MARIEIPDAQRNLRPSFSIAVFEDVDRRLTVLSALDWFASTILAELSGDNREGEADDEN